MKTPTIWANPDGTGVASTSDGSALTTELLEELTTEALDIIVIDAALSPLKENTLWGATDKVGQAWRMDGYGQAVNFSGSVDRLTVLGDIRITESGDVRIVEDAYYAPKSTNSWIEA